MTQRPKKLLDRVREVLRLKHYSCHALYQQPDHVFTAKRFDLLLGE